jgi:hypothetical protein
MEKRVVMLIGYDHEAGYPYQHRDWAMSAGGWSPGATIPTHEVISATTKAMAELGAVFSSAHP